MVVINLGGLVHDKVYRLKQEDDQGAWYDKSGDFGFHLGSYTKSITTNQLKKRHGYYQYISEDKENAELFHAGAKACMDFMKETWFQ